MAEEGRKIAVVTGASRGLGRDIAIALADQGWDVVAGCRDPGKALASMEEAVLGTEGKGSPAGIMARVCLLPLDLASFASLRSFAGTVSGKYGHIDLLVNNAGISRADGKDSSDGFELVMQTNFLSPFLLTELLLPSLLESPAPSVVNLTSAVQSASGWRALPRRCARSPARRPDSRGLLGGFGYYCASKFALSAVTAELARRAAADGLRAAVVHPGVIDTGIMFAKAWYDTIVRFILAPFFTDRKKGSERVMRAVEWCRTAPAPSGRAAAPNFAFFRGDGMEELPRALRDEGKRAALYEMARELAGAGAREQIKTGGGE